MGSNLVWCIAKSGGFNFGGAETEKSDDGVASNIGRQAIMDCCIFEYFGVVRTPHGVADMACDVCPGCGRAGQWVSHGPSRAGGHLILVLLVPKDD